MGQDWGNEELQKDLVERIQRVIDGENLFCYENTKNATACPATGNGDSAMTDPVYFNTYEEAESYSISIAPNQSKRKCGNCYR